MTRLTRILLVTISIVALTAGAALAGPGSKHASGDPDIPAITNPGGSKTPCLVEESSSSVMRSSRIDEETRPGVDSRLSWRIALRMYLRMLRVFPR